MNETLTTPETKAEQMDFAEARQYIRSSVRIFQGGYAGEHEGVKVFSKSDPSDPEAINYASVTINDGEEPIWASITYSKNEAGGTAIGLTGPDESSQPKRVLVLDATPIIPETVSTHGAKEGSGFVLGKDKEQAKVLFVELAGEYRSRLEKVLASDPALVEKISTDASYLAEAKAGLATRRKSLVGRLVGKLSLPA